jgi:hypothetical protein
MAPVKAKEDSPAARKGRRCTTATIAVETSHGPATMKTPEKAAPRKPRMVLVSMSLRSSKPMPAKAKLRSPRGPLIPRRLRS